jgi:tetratricopeptide (TPR) repeat protein
MAGDVSTPYVKATILWLNVYTYQAMDPPKNKEAIGTMQQIAKIRGGWTRGRMGWYAVFQVFGKAGDSDGAEAWYKACSTADPYSEEGRNGAMQLVQVLQGRKDWEAADAAYVAIVKQYPKSPTAQAARYARERMWWYPKTDYARALKVAEEYINLYQTRYAESNAYERVSTYNAGLQRWGAAIAALEKAMKLWPRRTDTAGLLLRKAEYQFQAGDAREAEATIKQVQARWRDVYYGVRAQDALAYLYLRGRSNRNAMAAYRLLVSKYPSSWQADQAKKRYE